MTGNGEVAGQTAVDLTVEHTAFIEIDGFIAPDRNDLVPVNTRAEVAYLRGVRARFLRIRGVQEEVHGAADLSVHFDHQLGSVLHPEADFPVPDLRHNAFFQRPHNR